MKVVLIHPRIPESPVSALMRPPKNGAILSPPWEMYCLQSYINNRTRHSAVVIDCNLLSDLVQELANLINQQKNMALIVVNAPSTAIGEAVAAIEIVRNQITDVPIAVCGQFPSQFPQHNHLIKHADFALAGDPEPILHNLLDNMDLPARLKFVPGLIFAGKRDQKAHWLKQLHSLALPDWTDIVWNAYRPGTALGSACLKLRISRGHTHVPADKAFGGNNEPLRFWPLDRMASLLQKIVRFGIAEVAIDDSPGVWTPKLLDEWCHELARVSNRQYWSLRMLPTYLPMDRIDDLWHSKCRFIDFILPSCDPNVLKTYGCIISVKNFANTIKELKRRKFKVRTHFWIGGPEEGNLEKKHVVTLVRELDPSSATFQLYPCHIDSPIYQLQAGNTGVEEWLGWLQNPWLTDRPAVLWNKADSVKHFSEIYTAANKQIHKVPLRFLQQIRENANGQNWIRELENRILTTILRRKSI